MKPKINKTSEYIEIVGHYDDSVLCAKLTLLADLYAIEHRYGYAKFRIEDEDKLELVNEKLDYLGQLYIYSNNGQTLLTHLNYGPFTSLTCTITSTGTNEDDMGLNYTYSGSQTFLGFSITANATVPDSDLEVGDSFRLDDNKTVYIVEGSSSTVTDLTGTKWKYTCTSSVSMSGPPTHVSDYSINGTINNQNFTGIEEVSKSSNFFYCIDSNYFSETTSGGVVNGTIGDEYIIEITGGTDATNSTLISWFQTNATQVVEPTETNTFSIGSLRVANAYFGLLQVNKIYLGNSLVWESATEPTPENALLAQDGALLVSGGGYLITTEVTLISFTIDGTSYQAEQGMTWEEWVNSTYNTNSAWCVNGNYNRTLSSSCIIKQADNIYVMSVKTSYTIVADYAYISAGMSGGGSSN